MVWKYYVTKRQDSLHDERENHVQAIVNLSFCILLGHLYPSWWVLTRGPQKVSVHVRGKHSNIFISKNRREINLEFGILEEKSI